MRKVWNQRCPLICLLLCLLFLAVCAPENAYADMYAMQASATPVSGSEIELRWNAVSQAGEYAIYRRTPGNASFQKIKTTPNTVYKDKKISAAVSYYYQIVPISRDTGKEIKAALVTLKAKAPGSVSVEKVKVKSPTKIQIYWTMSAGSGGYQILRSEGDGGRYEEIARVNGKTVCTYIDGEVTPGKTYYYKVRPMDQRKTGFGSYSAAAKGRTIAKTSITSITSLSSSQMRVTWKKVRNARTYEVYRSTKAKGGYRKVYTAKSGTQKFTDKTVKSGKKYYYKVVVTGSFNGERISSGYSEEEAFRALKQVRISSVKATSDDGLKIRWSKVTGATKYKIYRATSKLGSYKQIATVNGASSLNYTDRSVSSGKTYYYKVQAYSDGKGVITAGSGTRSEARGSSTSYAIMGKTSVTADQMAALYQSSGKKYPSGVYKSKGAKNIREFCEIVMDESEKEGVKAEVIFAQVCLETGYLQFGGQVSAAQCNFAGLGATDDGAAGATFPNVKTGIRAQVQHLKGYASKDDLNQKCVDPRFMYLAGRRGTAKYVQSLGGGNWATDPIYSVKLMGLIKAMKSY